MIRAIRLTDHTRAAAKTPQGGFCECGIEYAETEPGSYIGRPTLLLAHTGH